MWASDKDIHCNEHCHQSINHQFRKSQIRNDLPTVCTLTSDHVEDYVDLINDPATVKQWGQLKLLLTEIQFFTHLINEPELQIVYAGSSPGNHLPTLIECMPSSWTWYLYDSRPNPYILGCNEMIQNVNDITFKRKGTLCLKKEDGWEALINPKFLRMVHDNEFENAIKHLYTLLISFDLFKKHILYLQYHVCHSIQKDVQKQIQDKEEKIKQCIDFHMPEIFIKRIKSDIKKLEHSMTLPLDLYQNVHVYCVNLSVPICEELKRQNTSKPLILVSDIRSNDSEENVEKDMNLQKDFVQALKPDLSLLKFKLPYSKTLNLDTVYLDGDLMYQAYTRPISHETRLVVKHCEILKIYNHEIYSKSMFYFQTKIRNSIFKSKNYLATPEIYPCLCKHRICIDRCFDCTLCFKIAMDFLSSKTKAKAIDDFAVLDFLEKIMQRLETNGSN